MRQYQIIIWKSSQTVDRSCDNPAMLLYFDPVNLDLPFFHIGYKIQMDTAFIFTNTLKVYLADGLYELHHHSSQFEDNYPQ